MQVFVVGLGHIGLPIAAWIALKGYVVYGVDCYADTVRKIIDGTIELHEFNQEMHISQVALDLIARKRFYVSTEIKRSDISPCVFVIAVGIVPGKDIKKVFMPIQRVLDMLIPQTMPGDLLLFKTTMVPGMSESLILPQMPADLHIAYWPETLSEGHAFDELENHPNILAASNEESYRQAEGFIKTLSKMPIVRASNIKTAETAKTIQNIVRDVNIALANEVNGIAQLLKLDMYELRKLCNLNPRVELLSPGPGVGGACLPNALPYLQSVPELPCKFTLDLMEKARAINQGRPSMIVEAVIDALATVGKKMETAIIALSGLAMKDFCADCRNSPALAIADLLAEKGAIIRAFDPLILPVSYPFQFESLQDCVRGADCLVITAQQPGLEYDLNMLRILMTSSPIIIDTRGAIDEVGSHFVLVRP